MIFCDKELALKLAGNRELTVLSGEKSEMYFVKDLDNATLWPVGDMVVSMFNVPFTRTELESFFLAHKDKVVYFDSCVGIDSGVADCFIYDNLYYEALPGTFEEYISTLAKRKSLAYTKRKLSPVISVADYAGEDLSAIWGKFKDFLRRKCADDADLLEVSLRETECFYKHYMGHPRGVGLVFRRGLDIVGYNLATTDGVDYTDSLGFIDSSISGLGIYMTMCSVEKAIKMGCKNFDMSVHTYAGEKCFDYKMQFFTGKTFWKVGYGCFVPPGRVTKDTRAPYFTLDGENVIVVKENK